MAFINIEFCHHTAKQPLFIFGHRVAFICECQPREWPTAAVVGLQLQPDYSWSYQISYDSPAGVVEECTSDELVRAHLIPLLQAGWERNQMEEMRAAYLATYELDHS